jgi:hypothetical protein
MAAFFDNPALSVTWSITVYPGFSELLKIKPKTKFTFNVYIPLAALSQQRAFSLAFQPATEEQLPTALPPWIGDFF